MDAYSVAYPGTRYIATVPATLDLTERARLALNALGGSIDPDLDYIMWWQVYYAHRTPYMRHHAAETTLDPKFAESFPMMRTMCGSDLYADMERAQRAALIGRIEDGLFWNRYDPRRPWQHDYAPAFLPSPQPEDTSCVYGVARMIRALLACRELTGDDRWDGYISDLCGGLRRIAVYRDDYAYHPDGGFGEPFNYPRSGWITTREPQSAAEGGEGDVLCFQGQQVQALSRWYAASGDPNALDLATRMARFCLQPRFWGGLADPAGPRPGPLGHIPAVLPDPAGIAGAEQGHWYTHFHARAVALRGLLEYGRLTGDYRALEFVRRAYEYSWTMGISRLGWINCYPGSGLNGKMEGCALGDILALAIRLSDAGMGDYWDDVDAVVRNQLVEAQLVSADILEGIAAASPERAPSERSPYPGQEMSQDVIARSLGSFATFSTPTVLPHPWVGHCCTGNATQGLYYAWEGIVREADGAATVNLLLNRAARSLDIDSYLPFEGKVVLHNKSCRRITVRIPAWTPHRAVRALVSGLDRPLAWVGNYLSFEDLVPGDTITVTFPVAESTATYTAAAQTAQQQAFRCTFRGSTCVDITPRDESPTNYPIYRRAALRAAAAPMQSVERFVAGRTIVHW
jgi:hypothetical protein